MNPRLKSIAHLPSVESEDDSAFHVCIRSPPSRHASPTSSESSVEHEAALLLSISSICDREVKDRGFDAIFDDMPRFPSLVSGSRSEDQSPLKPRPELVQQEKTDLCALRARTVSIDSPRLTAMEVDRTASPVLLPAARATAPEPVIVSPLTPHATVRRLPARKPSIRLARQSRRESIVEEPEEKNEAKSANLAPKSVKGRTLQAAPPKGVPIKKIGRKKFSWKCYPEVSVSGSSMNPFLLNSSRLTLYSCAVGTIPDYEPGRVS